MDNWIYTLQDGLIFAAFDGYTGKMSIYVPNYNVLLAPPGALNGVSMQLEAAHTTLTINNLMQDGNTAPVGAMNL